MDQRLKDRLETEYRLIQEIPENDIMKIMPADGQKAPYVKEYWIVYHIPTYVEEGTETQAEITVRAIINVDAPPTVEVIKGKIPFNPNWRESGQYSFGSSDLFNNNVKCLREYLLFVGKNLQYQPQFLDTQHPADLKAALFVLRNPHLFPTDNRVFPIFPIYEFETGKKDAAAEKDDGWLNVEICLPSGERISIQVPEEMIVEDMLEQLEEASLIFPKSSTDFWVCTLEGETKSLDLNMTFAEIGLKNKDVIRISLSALAYGCPSAEEVPGLVPECMLTKYEGSEDELL